MVNTAYKSFGEYLAAKGINIAEEKQEGSDLFDASEQQVINQLELICDFHEKTMGYLGHMSKRLNNSTGKKVEEYKVYLKRMKRDLAKIERDGVSSRFESIILENGNKCIERAENCIKSIYEADYYGLIARSMKRIEICLGNTHHSNLRKTDKVEVVDLKHCAYNMVECDACYYLGKLKRNGANLDWDKLITTFCNLENLDENSKTFISAMISFPYEVLKCYTRYKYRKKDWTDEEYETRLLRAFEKDGCTII